MYIYNVSQIKLVLIGTGIHRDHSKRTGGNGEDVLRNFDWIYILNVILFAYMWN